MQITVPTTIDINDLAAAIVDQADLETLIGFIRQVDNKVADFDFTAALVDKLADQMDEKDLQRLRDRIDQY